jgi:hypothetical protein
MVISHDGFPGPECVTAARRIVVGVADDDPAAVGGGWILQLPGPGTPGAQGCPPAAKTSSS